MMMIHILHFDVVVVIQPSDLSVKHAFLAFPWSSIPSPMLSVDAACAYAFLLPASRF